MKKLICAFGLSTALTIAAGGAFAQSDAQKTMDKNMQNAKEVQDRQAADAAAKERESMRDKSHDGRARVNDHTSVGAKPEPGGASVNVKITEKPKN